MPRKDDELRKAIQRVYDLMKDNDSCWLDAEIAKAIDEEFWELI